MGWVTEWAVAKQDTPLLLLAIVYKDDTCVDAADVRYQSFPFLAVCVHTTHPYGIAYPGSACN